MDKDLTTMTTQFDQRQTKLMLKVRIAKELKLSKAEILRRAFDFYVAQCFPQLMKEV